MPKSERVHNLSYAIFGRVALWRQTAEGSSVLRRWERIIISCLYSCTQQSDRQIRVGR